MQPLFLSSHELHLLDMGMEALLKTGTTEDRQALAAKIAQSREGDIAFSAKELHLLGVALEYLDTRGTEVHEALAQKIADASE
jgi:hypothetical protein